MSDDNFFPIVLDVAEGEIRVVAKNVNVSGTENSITLHFHATPEQPTNIGSVSLGGKAYGDLAKFLEGGGSQTFARYMPKDPYSLPKCRKCGGRTFDGAASLACKPQKGLTSFYCHALTRKGVDEFEGRWAKVEERRRAERRREELPPEEKRKFGDPYPYGNDLGASSR